MSTITVDNLKDKTISEMVKTVKPELCKCNKLNITEDLHSFVMDEAKRELMNCDLKQAFKIIDDLVDYFLIRPEQRKQLINRIITQHLPPTDNNDRLSLFVTAFNLKYPDNTVPSSYFQHIGCICLEDPYLTCILGSIVYPEQPVYDMWSTFKALINSSTIEDFRLHLEQLRYLYIEKDLRHSECLYTFDTLQEAKHVVELMSIQYRLNLDIEDHSEEEERSGPEFKRITGPLDGDNGICSYVRYNRYWGDDVTKSWSTLNYLPGIHSEKPTDWKLIYRLDNQKYTKHFADTRISLLDLEIIHAYMKLAHTYIIPEWVFISNTSYVI